MGEIAEMMLEGILCAGCGEVLESAIEDGEAPGFPMYCSAACAKACGVDPEDGATIIDDEVFVLAEPGPKKHYRDRGRNRGKHECPKGCGMTFASMKGAAQHARDKHKEA